MSSLGQPLRWLGGPIDVRVEIDTGLTGATFGIWDQSLWSAATWGSIDPEWADITEFVEQVSIDQGKERWEQRFGAGTAQIVLNNTRGYFTPEIEGPFHLPFRPGRRIRVVAIPDPTADPHSKGYKVPLFTGTIDSSNDSYDEAGWNIRTVLNCVDFMALWQANNPPALENPTGVQSTDERVEAALDRVGVSGWPEDLRDIQEGEHTMQSSDLAQSTAEECHRAAEAEGGAFFCSKDGKATFKARDWLTTDLRSTTIRGYIGYDDSDAPSVTLAAGDWLPIPWDIRWDTSGSDPDSYFWGGARSRPWTYRTWDVDEGSLQIDSNDYITIGTYDPEEHRWMRITNNGTTVRWFTAPDFSGPWTEHYSEPAPDVDDWEVDQINLALPVFYLVVASAPALDFRVSWEMARIRNDIQFSRVGGSVQHEWDDTSIAAFGRRSYRRLDLYNTSDTQVELLAERALAAWKDSRLRVDAVTIGANPDPHNEDRNRLLWDSQFGDLLAVKVKTPYGWEYEKEVHIMGIRHLITPNDWTVTFTLDDAATFQQEED